MSRGGWCILHLGRIRLSILLAASKRGSLLLGLRAVTSNSLLSLYALLGH